MCLSHGFNAIWNDAGSGATRDGGFWHPITQGTLRPPGSMAVENFKELNGQRAALLIGAKSTSSSNPPVKAPTSYTQLWADKGSGAKLNGSFWQPIAPSSYIAMGDVVQSGYTTPSTSKYADESVWDDKMSGVGGNVSIWEVYPFPNNISGTEFLIDFAEFTQPVPTFTASTIPSTGTTYTWVGQCEVTLPFTSYYDDTHQRSLQLIRNPFRQVSRSITWYVEGSYINNRAGSITRSKQVTTGVSSGESTELAHSTGVSISASTGLSVKLRINLNYQFTHSSSSTYKIKAQRADGSIVTGQLEFNTNEEVYLSGVDL
ncbi:hypothetical protein BDV30DRAFT_231262 [Aspergillus minisclerotigenes]|uniref:Insecticidal crystal toxin domain-containing protein n=1 Tax=Aspergillus minisclerotigenes TaxID=656917 RepID=A0A5N6IMX0_9EURO|nr:hypothetical protein BDV30DRAFT_231262 [Aspergillus minisclerotigenes]